MLRNCYKTTFIIHFSVTFACLFLNYSLREVNKIHLLSFWIYFKSQKSGLICEALESPGKQWDQFENWFRSAIFFIIDSFSTCEDFNGRLGEQ